MMTFVRSHIQTLVTLALAAACVAMIALWPQWREALANEGYYGRMTGGGGCTTDSNGDQVHVTHGFILHCDATKKPNNLEVNWTIDGQMGSFRFHLDTLQTAICTNDPNLDEEQPVAGFDTYDGTGEGRYTDNQNNQCDASAEWTFTDNGEPGGEDSFEITITCEGQTVPVLDILCPLGGNHQAHRN
jgi:hypothetical protein